MMLKVGDLIEIPISGGRRAFGQYVFKDFQQGPLISIYQTIASGDSLEISDLPNSGPLFPPVITGLNSAVRTGLWKKIGKLPIINFTYPNFVSAYWDQFTGKVIMWFLWDGTEYKKIGSILPDQYKNLEYLVVWHPNQVIRRIETGIYPFPYGEITQRFFCKFESEIPIVL